ncbi:MAG: oligoendopeptidase F [Planctomycetaceae bacterium]|nr:oligoendopeptidase F [Planctomycetaceae bacterium]
MSKVKRLPARSRVKTDDTWDLSSLYASDEDWQKDLKKLKNRIPKFAQFKGRLGEGPSVLAKCLKFDSDFDRLAERLGVYAFLKTTEDQANGDHQNMMGQFQNVASRAAEEASFIRPELLSLSSSKLKKLIQSPLLKHYRLTLKRLVRSKPHTLGDREEQLLAMQSEMSQTASRAFRQLLDADMKFGVVKNEQGEQIELSNATFSQLLVSPSRKVRKDAFVTYYQQFEGHENTLAATLNGSIQKDVYYARARGYDSALHAALFPDNVPQSVYDKLISSVHRNLPALHRYYDLRRRKMKLKDIHHYDTYVPILSNLESKYTWKQAVKVIIEALQPLGEEYCSVLEAGLNGRWCDRYPNQGKQSGAFSCGSFDGDPYILMNYQPTVLNDVFTLAHEAGHSMHSYLSAKHQPYEYYDYKIFVAEVASTFNEELLSHHLLSQSNDKKQRAYLINREIDDIRGTIFRQTMFAEFEKITHGMAEAGEPLTLQAFKSVYRDLLEKYFGPQFALDEQLSLECLRIPHFYRAFYVYKYATGLSAAIALSQRVLTGGEVELQDYLNFLQSGCSKDPLDLLRDAGVDMEKPKPVNTALKYFEKLVDELDDLL